MEITWGFTGTKFSVEVAPGTTIGLLREMLKQQQGVAGVQVLTLGSEDVLVDSEEVDVKASVYQAVVQRKSAKLHILKYSNAISTTSALAKDMCPRGWLCRLPPANDLESIVVDDCKIGTLADEFPAGIVRPMICSA